jgi:16S rRNA (guanine1516-N2)-methyltransferase
VHSDEAALQDRALALAEELGLVLADASVDYLALLHLTPSRLELLPQGEAAPGPIAVDFEDGRMQHRRRAGHNEPLGRAVGVGKWDDLLVADATAGLGRDSYVLADLGCRVTMMEQSPAVFALLRDGLERGRASEDKRVAAACGRMLLERGAAESLLEAASYDVVYLDPMFPARHKSARVKKEMWLFQQLADTRVPAPGLLDAALKAASRRVVVKRPARAAPLGERKPAFEIPGKTVRFDVYLPAAESA